MSRYGYCCSQHRKTWFSLSPEPSWWLSWFAQDCPDFSNSNFSSQLPQSRAWLPLVLSTHSWKLRHVRWLLAVGPIACCSVNLFWLNCLIRLECSLGFPLCDALTCAISNCTLLGSLSPWKAHLGCQDWAPLTISTKVAPPHSVEDTGFYLSLTSEKMFFCQTKFKNHSPNQVTYFI